MKEYSTIKRGDWFYLISDEYTYVCTLVQISKRKIKIIAIDVDETGVVDPNTINRFKDEYLVGSLAATSLNPQIAINEMVYDFISEHGKYQIQPINIKITVE